MKKSFKVTIILLISAIIFTLSACKNDDKNEVVSLTIISSDSIMASKQETLKAKVLFEDGVEKISSVNWTSSNSELGVIEGDLLTALNAGDLEIIAEKDDITAKKTIHIVPDAVSINKTADYYNVTLNYNSNYSPSEMGAEYISELKEIYPDFEESLESYIILNLNSIAAAFKLDLETVYSLISLRVDDIKVNIPEKYQSELEGMASSFSANGVDEANDGKVSLHELYMYNIVTDVLRGTQCSAVGVFGDLSEDGYTTVGRNLDWNDGGILCKFASITTIKNTDGKSIVLIGYLAHIGMLTAFNEDGVFAGILDSYTGAPYSSTDKNSYVMDLRYALENSDNLDDISDYMIDSSREYTYGHLVTLADKDRVAVLENNTSSGVNNLRALRESNSTLNSGIEWGIDNAVGTVNSFMLNGNLNNFTVHEYNTARWSSMKTELNKYINSEPISTVSFDNMKDLMAFANGDGPGNFESGDLYTYTNLYTVIFQPETFKFSLAFKPLDGSDRPLYPKYNDITINF